MLLKPNLTSRPTINSITQGHNHVGEPALRLLMLRICYSTDVLWLVALATHDIPLHPRLLGGLLSLGCLLLSLDPLKSPGAVASKVIESTPCNPTIKTGADHGRQVALILIKNLILDMILAQNLNRTSKFHCPRSWQSEYKI